MQRYVLKALTAAVVIGLSSTSFANEAQPELQPTPVEFGSFKRPADATSYITERTGSTQNTYQFLNEHSPL
jgi:hypothetical protein